MAHALGDDRAAGVGGTKSLPGSLRDRYTNTTTTTGLNETTTTENDNNNKSTIMIRGNNVPSSRIVGFGTSPAVPVLARGGGKSFTERARSKLEQLKHKTQEALQARKERQQREQQQQQQQQHGTTTSGNVQNESTRELTRAMRRETVSEVVASATSAAELLFELRTCGLTDSGEGGEPDASTHDMIAEMTHVCEERRARLAGLAGNEGLSEANLVLVLETIEKVNGALDSDIDGPPSTTTTTTTTFIAASGEDENVVPAPPANPIGVSAGNPFATPALSSPITPSTRTVTRMDVPQTPEEEEAALAAAIAASLQIEDENKRKTTESQSLSLPAPPPQQQQQQQVSDSNDIGNLIDF